MNTLTDAQSYQVMQYLDPNVAAIDVLLKLKQSNSSELELTVFGMMDTIDGDGACSTLSTSREAEYLDLNLMHRPNDGEENIVLFEFENCVDVEFMSTITQMVSEMMLVEDGYVDGT